MSDKHNPWAEIKTMREEMDKIMNESFNRKNQQGLGQDKLSLWQPAADMYENTTQIVIELELPGVTRENINLEVQGEQLVVYGEKRMEKDASSTGYQFLERSYGPFSRVFVLPEYADTSNVKAIFSQGILSVTIAKTGKRNRTLRIDIE
ncbi:Hsp20/alpha crystallin family protein [Desulfonatronovibrio magnus]|uniref:Hsp20/alpha crystallin family protein n=1 Tax=Desulfonatronovibrio magnus TaxID=698827 RepID=UPI00069796C9|nr:Hsp20/alpha crystallin family protein [Desulfonatronovibrio magnus]RQD61825.1 MAG: Hsp20/alpha crystallin family protein [Desulfonatronovibrio sp. MSAO_Bac4]